jgi:methylmalonyl-CoA mutase N-terminal domain/subunit
VSLTAQQPEVNIARVAIQALSAALGGTQSLHTDAFDEAMALPTEKAARIALRTQQVLADETGVALVADPLGGSYYVEALTNDIEQRAEEVFAKLDEWGEGSMLEGVFAAIDANWFQNEIADAAYRFQQKLTAGRRIIVGMNRYTESDNGDETPILSIGPEVEETQLKRLGAVKAHRSSDAVADSLAALRGAAADPSVNLMPPIIEAVKTYATVGEIMAAMGNVFGHHVETPAL